jgi:2-oxoglutarate ferredoxin oxidoreductase subunit beta
MPGVKYLARETVADAPAIRRAAKSLRRAFECQENNKGFAFIEFIVPCPTGLKKSVRESYDWCKNQMTAYFKPGTFKDEVD